MIKFLIFVLLIPILSFGQKLTSTEKSGNANVYNDAIKHFITYTSKGDKSIYDTLLFLKDEVITDSLQNNIQNTVITFLDNNDIASRFMFDDEFILHKIFPLSLNNGLFWVKIVPFRVRKQKVETIFENTGTGYISYSFDSKSGQLKAHRISFVGY